ncbi:AP2-like ethylene-responsive transcription factor BBM1 [Humulus lupulus]|uniref:AP2-like ethylene-responsive transcription factor BBM1 n=1 Tax=Humulus lupulus TaxID=3486 RepID=UPI002B406881|nr:AP2-like ethylene-responsive transcription factor BBM1 [Humulus lupulus]
MGSMNWLGFSLSPQEPHHHHHDHQDHSQSTVSHHRLAGFNSDEISGNDVSGECFDLTSDHSTAPSLNQLPPPFGILEAFNRSNNHSQDWNNMNSVSETNYKTSSSDLSMLMGSNSQNQQQHEQPKLENFLGQHSFADHDHHHHQHHAYNTNTTADYMFQASCAASLNIASSEAAAAAPNNNGGASGGGGAGSSIGLSMIKTWLRNQPAPTPQPTETKNDCSGGGAGATAAASTTSHQTLSLSMSTGSQSSSALPLLTAGGTGSGGESSSISDSSNKQPRTTAAAATATGVDSPTTAIEAVPRKSIDTFGQRTSIYRGVTRHRWTGRYEAHLWDNSCRREGQTRKGRQGGYDKEEKAARAYDLAALKYWGTTTTTNFPISNYEKEVEEMKHMTRQEYVASLRRKSSGFSRGASIYRGVTRHHQHGRWQARIGRVAGNKDLYLGTFSTQEEAAEAYDIAAIKFRGLNAVTNFDMSRYDVKSILESSTLPIGGAAKRLKDAEQAEIMTVEGHRTDNVEDNMTSPLTDAITNYNAAAVAAAAAHHGGWPALAAFQQTHHQPFTMHNYPYGGGQRLWCKQEQDSDNSAFHHDQLQLSNTHNFFQPNSSSVLHNLMGMDSSSMEHSSGSNSVMYSSNGGDHHGNGYGNGGYVVPMATVITNDVVGNHQSNSTNNNSNGFGEHENVFGSSTSNDPYSHARSLYYMSQQSPVTVGVVKANSTAYDQGSACSNNWVPTAVPTLGPRSSNINMAAAVCHGTPTFTVWNDT